MGLHGRGHSSNGREKGLHSAIIDAGTVGTVPSDLREPTTSSRSVHGVKLAVLSPYDRKDVLKVAS